jgi:hypothetical protein
MKRPQRKEDGTYHINGKKFRELFGSRQQVMNGTCYKTTGELVKSDLMMNKWGRIVSRKKHATAKKEKRLLKSGYTAKKGKFGYVKVGTKKNRKTRKMRGGGVEELTEAIAALKIASQNLTDANPEANPEEKSRLKDDVKSKLEIAKTAKADLETQELSEEQKQALTEATEAIKTAESQINSDLQSGGKKSKKRRGGSNKLQSM